MIPELIMGAIAILVCVWLQKHFNVKKDMQPQLDQQVILKELVTAASSLTDIVEKHLQAAEIVGFSPVEAARKPIDLYLRDIAPLMKALKKVRGEDA